MSYTRPFEARFDPRPPASHWLAKRRQESLAASEPAVKNYTNVRDLLKYEYPPSIIETEHDPHLVEYGLLETYLFYLHDF